ncbi:zinc finger ZAT9-like [Olea europaea subsp. europaea]|uniref:Zinc finger ZAT9-like n=1 Tax=Olea europaea subsp. europaea TaxID=158383 RepID=A0A8S0SSI2_OLEEU|nr:zinc finger ZAT9-like [Olea europaea subsp. europaea]
MEAVQEQRHVCKICGKGCWSGKSLGGHMRVHSALISAMKKEAAEVKFDYQIVSDGSDDQEGRFQYSNNQSNSTYLDQEKIKNCGSNMGDDDPKASYELRENPKKSCRNFDAKHGDTTRNGTCKDCGKVFPSLRALSGHMRCHSIKKSSANQNHCKECGKGFDSMRALFGHMKSHSNKSRRVPDESAESSSDLDNLCHLGKKRSRIICKIDPSPSSSVVDFGEVEEVALCLIMLSRGVKNWDRSKSGTESSGFDSAFFGDESVCKDKGIDVNGGEDPSFDGNKVWKMGKLVGKFDSRILGSGNACSDKHVPCSDDLNSGFSSGNEMKVNSEISDGLLKSSCCDKALVGGHDSEFGKYLSENAHSDPKMLIDFDEKFDLKMVGSSSSVEVDICSLSVAEANSKIECNGIASFECSICLRVFSSGQALGGHKRVHSGGLTENKTNKPVAMDGDFDLNVPISIAEGEKEGVGVDQWWYETRQYPMIAD